MDNTTRDHWVRAEAERLTHELAGLGYTPDECLRLAMLMHDMDVDQPTRDLSPEQVILQAMIAMQGFDDMTASVLARTLTKLDWGKLEISSAWAADLLNTTRNTLLNNMVSGNVPAKNVMLNRKGDRQDMITYWLSRILIIRAWRRRHPRTGGPVSGFPPAEYNPARVAIERRRLAPVVNPPPPAGGAPGAGGV